MAHGPYRQVERQALAEAPAREPPPWHLVPRPRPRLAIDNPPPPVPASRDLGDILVAGGLLRQDELDDARRSCRGSVLRLGDVLLSRGLVGRGAFFRALARAHRTELVDLVKAPPDVRLIDEIGLPPCLEAMCVPWKRVGDTLILACAFPDRFPRLRHAFDEHGAEVRMVVARDDQIRTILSSQRNEAMVERAETRVPGDLACRTWRTGAAWRVWALLAALIAALLALSPVTAWALLTGWAVLTLLATSGVKLAAVLTRPRARHGPRAALPRAAPHDPRRSPVVTILVPLFREREIAGRLVKRLERLTYPRERLDICLVVEEDDTLTQGTLAGARLPPWMRQVTVPRGSVRTKPRALNYALDFARGTIIGIYDAEDAPDPDQIDRIAARFAEAGPNVACLQGTLDYYNARTNWLSRCFTIEYATWFRIVLPGLARMGFAVPLGGTTLFLRRAALEAMGGWDAHNVTEDADLGIRLAREGFSTELIDTVTGEEANCRAWPWIKQRSRWIKGYAMTYGVHMRDPVRLWRELGARKFLGFQLVFLGTLSHLLLAPVLWSYWGVAFGLPHPLAPVIPGWAAWTMLVAFLGAEAINLACGLIAVSGKEHRFLRIWVPTLHLYTPLASLAALKGLAEILRNPYFWDKTQHGHDDHAEAGPRPDPGVTAPSNPA
ncbi:glycosyltransferase family 2 protein [Maritimibacter harenae]|nr:glycosyltransferase family 2 protein [Maritimibacter harenae]